MRAWRSTSLLFVAVVLVTGAASAATTKSVPVVTQVQGLTFYRTSITISNGSVFVTTPVNLLFSYRSPVDGSFQEAIVSLSPNLGPRRVRFFDDIIQAFKDAGAIRSQDANAALFGTLLVTSSLSPRTTASKRRWSRARTAPLPAAEHSVSRMRGAAFASPALVGE